jgi:hypothetical protein
LIKVPYAELYATHIENKIRAENGIALRVSYATAGSDADRDLASLLIRPGTRESLYYNSTGHTDYRPLRRREEGERY